MGKNFQSLAEIQEALTSKSISVEQLVSNYLLNIEKHNARLNVFLEVFADEAIAKAKSIDKKLAEGSAGKLAGLVVGIKDVICYKDHKLTCGSKILEGFESQFSATCVNRLLQEDAIIVGRQNCDEFAMGSSNENSAYGLVRNGADENTVPGVLPADRLLPYKWICARYHLVQTQAVPCGNQRHFAGYMD